METEKEKDTDMRDSADLVAELKSYQNSMRSVQNLMSVFNSYVGENARFDMLLRNLNRIVTAATDDNTRKLQCHSEQQSPVLTKNHGFNKDDRTLNLAQAPQPSLNTMTLHLDLQQGSSLKQIRPGPEHYQTGSYNSRDFSDNYSNQHQHQHHQLTTSKRKLFPSASSTSLAATATYTAASTSNCALYTTTTDYESNTKKFKGFYDAQTATVTRPGVEENGDNGGSYNQVNETWTAPQDYHVFTVELVMLKILKDLTVDQLMHCRRVCTSFRNYATQVLHNREREVTPVKFEFNWSRRQYYKVSGPKLETKSNTNNHGKSSDNFGLNQTQNEQDAGPSASATKSATSTSGTTSRTDPSHRLSNINITVPLRSLTNFLQVSTHFPFNSFAFIGGNLASLDLQEFLSFHGKFVKSLLIELYCPPPATGTAPTTTNLNIRNSNGGGANQTNDPEPEQRMRQNPYQHQPNRSIQNSVPNQSAYCDFNLDYFNAKNFTPPPELSLLQKLLLDQAPELSCLDLNKFPYDWTAQTDKLFPLRKPVYLGNIKSVSLTLPDEILEDLLRACVNLREIIRCPNITSVIKAKKLHLLKTMLWVPKPEDIPIFAGALPFHASHQHQYQYQLTNIILSFGWAAPDRKLWPSLSRVLNEILTAGASTLSIFCLGSTLGFLNDLVIPELPKVNFLKLGLLQLSHLSHTSGFSRKIFPPGFQLSWTFPNLTFVNFSLYHLGKEERAWGDYFDDWLEPVSTVKTVSFDKTMFLPPEWMAKFSKLFPNVEELSIKTKLFNYLDAAKGGLWNFENLQKLNCEINLILPGNFHPFLDSAFTGFSTGFVQDLQATSEKVDYSNVHELRERNSIVNLQNLRNLNLTFVDESEDVRAQYLTKLTHLTGQFAFQMCPFLEVKVEYRISQPRNLIKFKTAMSPLFPFVDIDMPYF